MTTVESTRLAPGALPILGHATRLAAAPLPFLTSLPTAGDVVRIRLGPWPVYVVCHPDLVDRVLTDDRTFDKGGPFVNAFRAVAGDGLGTCPYRVHRRRRQLLAPAFDPDRLAGYAEMMAERIAATIAPWRDQQIIDVPSAMHGLTTRIVTRTLFAAEPNPMAGSVDTVLAGVARRLVLPVPALDRIPTPGNLRFTRARHRLRHLTGRLMEQYRHTGTDHGDVLSLLLTARDENGVGLTDEEIRDEVVQFFLTGIESTPALLSWTWLLLDRHPDIRARLQAEVDTVLDGRIARYTDLPRLDVTARIITEALRLYPPTWLVTRTTTTKADLGGHRIPAHSTVAYSPCLTGRRAVEFPEPDRFDPDRWLAAPPARGAFVPFGGGPRRCVGDVFTTTQATLTVATIASRWRLHSVPKTQGCPVARHVLVPRAAPMRLRRRG